MPSCQKIEKESLRPLLFKVNREFHIVIALRRAIASWHIFFFIVEKAYENKSKSEANPKSGSKAATRDN